MPTKWGMFMNPKCKQVIENLSLHRNPDLTHREKVQLKGHLIECAVCQAEHEDMLHTAAILESLPEPVPPLDLVERIQARIRQGRRHLLLNFFVNPIARVLLALKLGPHPTFFNYTAMVFYLVLTIFLVKLTFFGPTEPPPVAPLAVKPLQPHTRIIQLGAVKRAALQSVRIEDEKSKEVPIKPE